MDDKVSIITPVYNGEKYLAETIQSVTAQTYTNFELIIVDDGSKDLSKKIAKKFAEKDARIHVVEQPNAGSAAARNHGIRKATGRYIALLDADDLWEPDFLEKQLKFMQDKEAACVFCSYKRIDENSKDCLKPSIALSVVKEGDMRVMNRIGCLTGLYDTKMYGKVYLHENLKSLRDDYAYWYDIVKMVGTAYGNKEILAKYRVLPGSTTGKKKKLIRVQYKFYRNYIKESPMEALINLCRWGISGLYKFS